MENIVDTADRIALQDVLARYAAGVDERDFDLYRSCFMEDVELTGFGRETIKGLENWMSFVKTALDRYGATQHMLGPQLATIDGDKASTRTDLQARHYMKEDPEKTFTLWATYKTDMVRTSEGWKIARHHLESRGSKVE